MSVLYWYNYRTEANEVQATFDGSAVATLGAALNHFTANEQLWTTELQTKYPDMWKLMTQWVSDAPCSFTVIPCEHGFVIHVSDGPDKYLLLDK